MKQPEPTMRQIMNAVKLPLLWSKQDSLTGLAANVNRSLWMQLCLLGKSKCAYCRFWNSALCLIHWLMGRYCQLSFKHFVSSKLCIKMLDDVSTKMLTRCQHYIFEDIEKQRDTSFVADRYLVYSYTFKVMYFQGAGLFCHVWLDEWEKPPEPKGSHLCLSRTSACHDTFERYFPYMYIHWWSHMSVCQCICVVNGGIIFICSNVQAVFWSLWLLNFFPFTQIVFCHLSVLFGMVEHLYQSFMS